MPITEADMQQMEARIEDQQAQIDLLTALVVGLTFRLDNSPY